MDVTLGLTGECVYVCVCVCGGGGSVCVGSVCVGSVCVRWSRSGKAAEGELKVLVDKGYNIEDNDLIRHNLVVFRCACSARALSDGGTRTPLWGAGRRHF